MKFIIYYELILNICIISKFPTLFYIDFGIFAQSTHYYNTID
jgi:hypothetical protein